MFALRFKNVIVVQTLFSLFILSEQWVLNPLSVGIDDCSFQTIEPGLINATVVHNLVLNDL